MSNKKPSYVHQGGLRLLVDGKEIVRQHAGQDRPVVEVGPGLHTFRWTAVSGPALWDPPVLDDVVWTPAPAIALLPVLGGNGTVFFAGDAGIVSIAQGAGRDGGDALRLMLHKPVNEGSPDRDVSMWFSGPGHVVYWAKRHSSSYLTMMENGRRLQSLGESWTQFSLWLGPGENRLKWTLSGDYSSAVPDAQVLLERVTFTASVPRSLASAVSGGGASMRPWRTSSPLAWSGFWDGDQGVAAYAPPSSASASSWIETDVTGPAVVTYRSTGNSVSVIVGGITLPYRDSVQLKAVYIPPGQHTVRWLNEGNGATLSDFVHRPMGGVVRVEEVGGELRLTVPRPYGISDSGMQVQVLHEGEWQPEPGAVVTESSGSRVLYRLPPVSAASLRFYRVSFRAP